MAGRRMEASAIDKPPTGHVRAVRPVTRHPGAGAVFCVFSSQKQHSSGFGEPGDKYDRKMCACSTNEMKFRLFSAQS